MTNLVAVVIGIAVLIGIYMGARLVTMVVDRERASQGTQRDARVELETLIAVLDVVRKHGKAKVKARGKKARK